MDFGARNQLLPALTSWYPSDVLESGRQHLSIVRVLCA